MATIGAARIEYSFSYPAHWELSIPTGRNAWRTEQTDSLQSALLTVAELGFELEVDDWTYQLTATEGSAQPVCVPTAPAARRATTSGPDQRTPTGARDPSRSSGRLRTFIDGRVVSAAMG